MKIINKKNILNPLIRIFDYVKDEIEILKKLCCKYIVRTYEIIETPSNVYIVMDLVEGNSLINHLADLDVNDIWRYFRNLISAVEYSKKHYKNFQLIIM